MSKVVTALLAVALLVAASGGCGDPGAGGPPERAPDVAPSAPGATGDGPDPERPAMRVAAPPGLKLSRLRRAWALRATHGFAFSLTRWLYGDRSQVHVVPLAPPVRRELTSSPPYIPSDQRGTGEGRVERLELALQSERSGIVTVTIDDLRTSYRVPAALDLRRRRWQIVHLKTH